MNRMATFDELAAEFHRRVSRIVWCTLATVAPDGMPWTRVLRPIWEASGDARFAGDQRRSRSVNKCGTAVRSKRRFGARTAHRLAMRGSPTSRPVTECDTPVRLGHRQTRNGRAGSSHLADRGVVSALPSQACAEP